MNTIYILYIFILGGYKKWANVSKSGIGWSVVTKGFRYTKRADGKTQKTYSISGTGISYVDVK